MCIRVRLNNPKLIRWARESAGLTIEDIARITRTLPTIVEGWEDGSVLPTMIQLRHFARKAQRPLSALFLPEIPEAEDMAEPVLERIEQWLISIDTRLSSIEAPLSTDPNEEANRCAD